LCCAKCHRCEGYINQSMPTYDSLVSSLYRVNLFQPGKLCLKNISKLNSLMGDPAKELKIIHLAGTNGKGSVSFKIAKTLECSGYTTGLFVSPHISSFRERIQINGKLITEDEVVEHLTKVNALCEENEIPATFFERVTATAFSHFKHSKAEVVVLEAGLGGRLDATNIITPILSIITSIGLDHTKILGETIEAIANEKAGIIKPGVPVIVGKSCPFDQLKRIASSKNSRAIRPEDVEANPYPNPYTMNPDELDYDTENSYTASSSLAYLKTRNILPKINDECILSGVKIRPPCRFEILSVNSGSKKIKVVLDVAHNPIAIEKLVKMLKRKFPGKNFRFMIGMSRDKDIKKILRTVGNEINNSPRGGLHFARANTPRAASFDEIEQIKNEVFSDWRRENVSFDERNYVIEEASLEVKACIRQVLNKTDEENEVVVICGSVFIMCEVRQALGYNEPADSSVIEETVGIKNCATQDNLSQK